MVELMSALFRVSCRTNKLNGLLRNTSCLPEIIVTPFRTTMIVKRRFPVGLYKEGNNPRLKRATFFYDLEENTDLKPDQMMDVVLTSYVSGVGNPGDIVSLKRQEAYNNFILPGLATYPTPENLEYSKNLKSDKTVQEKTMTPSEEWVIRMLSGNIKWIGIVMNKETEWTLEPWHVRASFRKAGIHILSESAIELPPKPIRGPDMNLESKEFYVMVTVNKKHKVKVRCRIHHWSTDVADRLPWEPEGWTDSKEMIFPEDEVEEKDSSDIVSPKPT